MDHRVKKDRRNFIKTGIGSLAGMAVLPSILKDSNKTVTMIGKSRPNFIYRKLGKTGLKLPIVGMGVMNADNPQLVRRALELGITHLDTAHYYSRGRNESMVGEVIKDFPRDSFILATKVRASTVDRESAPQGDAIKEETFESFINKVEISLKRLKTDYVDILYLHSVKSKEAALNEMVFKAMQKLKKDGKIRFIGISTHRNEPEVITAAVESKIYEVILTAYNFRQRNSQELEKALERAANSGLGIVAMKTQAGVFWDKERKNPINMKAALKWALQNENIHTSIPGFTTFDQLETDISVMENLILTPQEKTDLRVGQKETLTGLYCQQCGQCSLQCPNNLDIPKIMRGYMYGYGYKNLLMAKETMESLKYSSISCSDCQVCNVTCTMGFDIKEKILDISRIKAVPRDLLV
jgi:predicted aldo/keto reductase-like oxidoreductase